MTTSNGSNGKQSPTGHLYAVEEWGGIYAAAFWQEVEPGRLEPVWQENISREKWARLQNEYAGFESEDQPGCGMRFYDLSAQQAEALATYADALRERNEMTSAAMAGEL